MYASSVSLLQIKALQVRPVKLDEDGAMQEFNRPNRSISKEHLSEVRETL